MDGYSELCSYTPPEWAKNLSRKPMYRFQLCMKPTPIHKWSLPGVPSEFQVSVKREDLTGSTLTGNKVRKLEFLLADAVQQSCDTVVTIGGPQSNHCRATAFAARQLGLETHIFILPVGQEWQQFESSTHGNALLSKLAGAKFIVFPLVERYKMIQEKMKEYVEKINAEGKHKAYLIPPGGACTLAVWGYFDAFKEMISQGLLENFDDILVPAGSIPGMVAGLAIANYLTGSHIKLHAVPIAPGITEEMIFKHVDECLSDLGLTTVKAQELIDPVLGYGGLGYDISSDEELESIVEVTSATGVPLDPTFGVKAVRGMIGEMNKNPGRFAGKRVLYIQTGGIYTLFDGQIDHIVRSKPVTNQVYKASDIFPLD